MESDEKIFQNERKDMIDGNIKDNLKFGFGGMQLYMHGHEHH